MEMIVLWYALFAATTSFASLYELIIPVMMSLEKVEPDNPLVENKIIAYITFFLFGLAAAPLLIFSTIVPSFAARFRAALFKTLHTDTKI
jgi:hypothetical protein